MAGQEEGGEEEEPETATDGVSMPSAETGCWHHKVCYKPVETDEDGVAELPADIRQAVVEAKRAEEAGKVERAHRLYGMFRSNYSSISIGNLEFACLLHFTEQFFGWTAAGHSGCCLCLAENCRRADGPA